MLKGKTVAIKKELFINALQMIEVDERQNIPTVVLFDKTGNYFGFQAIDLALDVTNLNENFKLNLGESAASRLEPPKFDTGDGKSRSAHEITKVFIEELLKNVIPWIESKGLKTAKRVLIAEPLAIDRTGNDSADWLANYRAKMKAILQPFFIEIDFLPEPFAVFQYYRYGLKHPLLSSSTRHAALVVDFGGGTFDVSVVDTTATGDVSGGGRNSRPLAAASIPVGGSFVNQLIARSLMGKNFEKGIDNTKVSKGWEAYKTGADSLGGYQTLRDDLRQFVRNAKAVLAQVEKAKIHICDTLADWDLEAKYEPGPGMQISVPKNPFISKTEFNNIRFDAIQLRDIFVRNVWHARLKLVMESAISRAKEELGGRPINIILLSGGSANIRWLTKLIENLIVDSFPSAEVLELQESFQEVVSKGLAIECARRTFNQGVSDFQAVTYNRLCLVLGPDEQAPFAVRYRPMSENISIGSLGDGTLLESAFLIADAQERPLRWKFRLSSPPKHCLDYYFLKSSLDFNDIKSLHNIDYRVNTPKHTAFDSRIILELTVAKDGTAYPKFIYRQGHQGTETVFVEGKPFFLDMTYGEKTTAGDAYIGIDFGTSNSSVSYIEQQAVKVYKERATDKGWRELNDLVSVLPYPASNLMVKFVGSATEKDIQNNFIKAFEAILFTIFTVAFVDYRSTTLAKKSSTFRQFTKKSAGPIWGALKSFLEKKGKKANFFTKLSCLVEDRNKLSIDLAIDAINDYKHGRASNYQANREILAFLGNTLHSALDGWRFGQFESVTKKGFSSQYSGRFRAAHGAHPPFTEMYSYNGSESFSDMEAVLVSQELKLAIRLSPFMFWTQMNARGEQTVASLDSTDSKKSEYIAIADGNPISINSSSDLADLHQMCMDAKENDAFDASSPCIEINLLNL